MAEIIKLVQGDSRPSLTVTLTDSVTDTVMDLTNCTVIMKFREAGAADLVATIPGSIIDAVNGLCIFHWPVDALSGLPGPYEGEVSIVYPGDSTHTVYDTLRFFLREQF